MFLRVSLALTILLSSFLPALEASTSPIPSQLTQTRALDADLARLASQGKQTSRIVGQMKQDVRSARNDVDRARRVIKSLKSLENRLSRMNSRLKPYLGIPKIRTIAKMLRTNLTKVHSQVSRVRKKAERVDKQVLVPLRAKLVAADAKLTKAQKKVNEAVTTAQGTRGQLAQVARLAMRDSAASRRLEQIAGITRRPAAKVIRALTTVNSKANSVRGRVSGLRRALAAFKTVESGLGKVNTQLRPADKLIADIDKVLSKRIAIKLPVPPFKKVGFSVRQILEKPGDILGVILKPLEKLVEKALDPLFKKAKLQIQPPRGLATLNTNLDKLSSLSAGLDASLRQFESAVQGELTQSLTQLQRDTRRILPHVGTPPLTPPRPAATQAVWFRGS